MGFVGVAQVLTGGQDETLGDLAEALFRHLAVRELHPAAHGRRHLRDILAALGHFVVANVVVAFGELK